MWSFERLKTLLDVLWIKFKSSQIPINFLKNAPLRSVVITLPLFNANIILFHLYGGMECIAK